MGKNENVRPAQPVEKDNAFKDPGLQRYALYHWDTNRDGHLQQSELDAVTAIPESAFAWAFDDDAICIKNPNDFHCSDALYSIEELSKLKNLRKIGYGAFAARDIAVIDLPRVEFIGENAFLNCRYIHKVNYPMSKLSKKMPLRQKFPNCPIKLPVFLPDADFPVSRRSENGHFLMR